MIEDVLRPAGMERIIHSQLEYHMSVIKTPVTPVPLYLLCGPLGAGKTTLLLQLLNYWRRRRVRVGVLMNEAGAVSVDGPLAANLAEEILEISGGCVCCDGSDEIVWGLKELLVDRQVEVVVLECSGMAQVGDVLDVITELNCRSLVELTKVIGVVQRGSCPRTGDLWPDIPIAFGMQMSLS